MRASVSSTGVHATMYWWKVRHLKDFKQGTSFSLAWLTGSGFSASFLWQSTRNPCEKRKNSQLHRKAKQLTQHNGNGQSASVKMAAKSWSLLPFAFHVNAMLNLSSPWPDVRPVFFDPFLKTCFVEQCFLQWLFCNHFLQHAERYILHLPWQSKQETHNSTVPVANRKRRLMPHAMKSS